MNRAMTALCGWFVLALAVLPVSACLDESLEPETLGELSSSIVFSGHEYLFVSTPKDWQQARSICQSQGYDLLSVESLAEENFVAGQQVQHGGGSWWIGYNDIGIEGTWRWSNSSTSFFTNWTTGEPNDSGGNEDCASDSAITGQWNDVACSVSFKFVCEKSPPLAGNNGTCPPYTAVNTNSATVATANCSINLFAGMLLTVGTCGLPGAVASGDTFIRLNNPMAVEIASNDNACNTAGSNLSVVIPTTGTYILKQGCAGNTACGGTSAFIFF